MERILLVEALIAEQQRVTKFLTDAGFMVTASGDGDWSLAYWHHWRPKVVVIGDAFGGRIKNSEQLVEAIKQLDPNQPFVLLRKSDAQLLYEISAF